MAIAAVNTEAKSVFPPLDFRGRIFVWLIKNKEKIEYKKTLKYVFGPDISNWITVKKIFCNRFLIPETKNVFFCYIGKLNICKC